MRSTESWLMFILAVPALFVLLWSTGWVVAKYAILHADPLTFLALRYAVAIAVLSVFCLFSGAQWPKTGAAWRHAMFSGVLLHGLYLASVWWAIGQGVPAGISGIIAALQPLMTAALAPTMLGERLTSTQRLGLLLGFSGIVLAVVPKVLSADPGTAAFGIFPVCVNVAGMSMVTLGTIYQKRFLQTGDIRTIAVLQYAGALIVTLPLALALEDLRLDWTVEMLAALAWAVLGLSIGAVALLLFLIRRGQVSRAASLIYLVPPLAALQAFLIFDEALTLPMIVGTAIAVFGVYLTNRKVSVPAT